MPLVLGFGAILGGTVLAIAGVTGSSIGSVVKGHPDKSKATPATILPGSAAETPATGANKAGSTSEVGAQGMAFFQAKGLTHAQAAGIIGNLQQESGLNPKEANGKLAQWLGNRLAGLDAFAHAHGESVDSPNLQFEYIWYELNSTESGALAALRQTTTPEQAARVFSEQYERPSEPMIANRERYAAEAAGSYR